MASSTRTRFLVTYDIRDARRLRRVHRAVSGYGDSLQYSVYVCDLSRGELIALKERLMDLIDLDLDNISIFDLGPPHGEVMKRAEHLGRRPNLPSDGPRIF